MAGDNHVLYRFELLDGKAVKDSFNFVLAPQNVAYDGKYRDNIYKTFGGTKLDIWGMDNQTIKLSGTLSGSRLRSGWAGQNPMTAVQALKYFRDKIWKYPENPMYGIRWPYMQVKLYDLDLNDPVFVHINSFSYSRAAGKPFFWDFQLNLTVVPQEKTTTDNGLFKVLKYYKENVLGKVLNVATMVSERITTVVDEIKGYLDAGLGFADATVAAMSQLVSTADSIVNTLLNVPGDMIDRLTESVNGFRGLSTAIASFVANDVGFVGEYKEYLTSKWDQLKLNLDATGRSFDYAVSLENMRRIYSNAFVNPQDDLNSTAPATPGSPAPLNAPPVSSVENNGLADGGQQNGTTSTFIFDHVEELTIGNNMTINDIAVKLYGEESMVPVLLELNGLRTSFLSMGQVIKIPVLASQKTIPGNLVISRDDNFGKDILLDEQGNLLASSTGDIQTVLGVDNMAHIVSNIVNLDMGTYLSDPAFGLGKKELIGQAGVTALVGLVGLKVREAILKDPRIADMTNFDYTIEGDVLNVSGTLVLHNGMTRDVRLSL